MEVLDNRLVVWPLRQVSEAIAALRNIFDELVTTLDLTDEDSNVLSAFLDLAPHLVYSTLLRQLDISVSEICWRLRFVYDPGEDASDALDISMLQYVDAGSGSIELCIELSDREYAKYLRVERLIELPSGRLRISLRPSDPGVRGRNETRANDTCATRDSRGWR